ncbi:L-asparaginase II [Pullulanibacillus pueri]|uniref:Asparaginase n=1 Tax=Pullulanibacillus pueri TaxID=1437324 RepID=A0A8J2ZST4_9BACL|nr:asparaginase [Pullulanibacillus pueri]MBM7681860.1 L-asparaginase II [Pullulanibacillus pueri]GGH76380.1 asparaginase [Pullulanibacillus pueri]
MVKMNPIKVYRGQYLESTHDFHAAVVDKEGRLLYSYGNPERNTFARSSMKPFQAIPLIETGAAEHYNYGAREIAISCASHSGEDFHRETVQDVLDRIDLKVNDLQCGMHPPKNDEDYKALLRSGGDLTPLYSNCSGKHSGMLATAVHMHEDYKTYRDIDHPVQQRIIRAISEVCNTPIEAIDLGVDGCGVPVHRLPLKQTAYGYAQLAAGQSTTEPERSQTLQMIRDAMMAYPEMVAGTDCFDTDFMKMFPGKVVSKGGAEGVQCFGLVEEGLGFIIKCEDGNPRALSAITLKILEDLGFVSDELKATALYQKYRIPTVKNMRKDNIGDIEVDFELKKENE